MKIELITKCTRNVAHIINSPHTNCRTNDEQCYNVVSQRLGIHSSIHQSPHTWQLWQLTLVPRTVDLRFPSLKIKEGMLFL